MARWLLSCGGLGVADGQADGPVAEVGDEVQAAAEGLDVAGDDLEGGDLAVLDLGHPGDADAHGGGDLPWPRPSCLRVSASWCPRARASSRRAPASISSGETPPACSSRDVYGSRFLLMTPFSYDGGAPDHWYAWDIDVCWIAVVVGAGVFGSAEDALREWRDVVGPAASGAAPSPCTAGMTTRLLAPCLRTGLLADMLQGSEPRDLIREHYRLRRRACDLTGSAHAGGVHPRPMTAASPMRSWTGTPHGMRTSPGQ